MTVTFRQLVAGLRDLGLDGSRPVIAHASLSAFGHVQGGASTLVGALLATAQRVMMPTFTYRTMITPRVGPPNNALEYGRREHANLLAEFYHADMPADPLMGVTAETLRRLPEAQRSNHPIYSFSGVGVEEGLRQQSVQDPFAPIRWLTEQRGFVLLLGVGHTANTSIHYGEQLAGRKQFIRWALTPRGVVECPHWPGCSRGFDAISPHVQEFTRRTQIGQAEVQLLPLSDLLKVVVRLIAGDPLALLCHQPACLRCEAVRKDVASSTG
ncbi:MAG: aminoglycoside N(3)-acetyltransferase [Anaerolineae bacterium]|nr:MAG: aminoglycoside N(3)-acetyltransferase [Anaerolineae bacterium]